MNTEHPHVFKYIEPTTPLADIMMVLKCKCRDKDWASLLPLTISSGCCRVGQSIRLSMSLTKSLQ